jgi:lipoprotein-anchoring transpeptidase ErfK/SrfK
MNCLIRRMEKISEINLSDLNPQGKPDIQGNQDFVETGKKRKSVFFPVLVYVSVPVLFYLLWILMFSSLPYMQETLIKMKPALTSSLAGLESKSVPKDLILQEENRVKKLDKTYAKFSNRQPYLIVNTSDHTFTLFNNGKLVREGICSTGSYILLDAGDGQTWRFETPKGMMHIQGKTESPVWRKPDWAFIEEGLPVPKHANSFERYEYGAMGDYALSIGNGYLIHGTLYTRLLGMPVTHGCVRLGDADLEKVFYTLRVGSKVYIF